MTESIELYSKAVTNFSDLLTGEFGAFHHAEFQDVSRTMLNGYSRFTNLGIPGQTVAHAMLSATVNLYRMFDMYDGLPDLLRELALRMENEAAPRKTRN
jgi:hypothetical protein